MDGLPSVIPNSITEVLNRLENDEDNQFSWKLTRSLDSLSLTVRCKFRAKTSNKAEDDSEVTGRGAVSPLKRHRKKKSPSALARSKQRLKHFLEQKSAGKPDSASPEDKGITTVPCGQDSVNSSNSKDLKSLENPTSAPSSDASGDLTCGESSGKPTHLEAPRQLTLVVKSDSVTEEQAILCGADIDSDDDFSDTGLCANCNRAPTEGDELKSCARCHFTRYCSVKCQRKDLSFHRFAFSVVDSFQDSPDNSSFF